MSTTQQSSWLAVYKGTDYNGKIHCVTPTQYGGRYITWHSDKRL